MTPQLEICIRRGQWQHVAAMTGMTEDKVRGLYGKKAAPVTDAEPASPDPREVQKALREACKVISHKTSRGKNGEPSFMATPEGRAWVADMKRRWTALGWKRRDVAAAAAIPLDCITSEMAVSGHMSPHRRGLIEQAITYAESLRGLK